MKPTDISTTVADIFSVTNRINPFLLSPPGSGKTAIAKQVADALGLKLHMFYASMRDPVDLLGTPAPVGEVTYWRPPSELMALTTGRNLLVLDEASDCGQQMQNALCSLVYERGLNNVRFSDETYILLTGNRTEDKSGAQRIVTKLGNRCMFIDYDVNIEDWAAWAMDNDIDPVLIQFLRYRSPLLSNFDPNRRSNPTPRAWEFVAMIPTTMPSVRYFEAIKGIVGEGAAAEYTGFRRIYESLPDIDHIVMNPATADVPTDPAVLYAITGALADRSTKNNFDRMVEYITRLPAEFSVMCVNDAQKKRPEVKMTKGFVKWATQNAEVLM